MKKKILALILLAILVLNSSCIFAANAFSDVDINHWAANYIYGTYALKIVNGYGDGTFRPSNQLKTGEFIKMISMAMWPSYEYKAPDEGVHWSMPYVETLDRIILSKKNYDNEKLESIITREEAAELICLFHVNYYGEKSDKVITKDEDYIKQLKDEASITNASSRIYINNCVKFGLINGFEDGTFRPTEGLTRAQATKIIYTAMFND